MSRKGFRIGEQPRRHWREWVETVAELVFTYCAFATLAIIPQWLQSELGYTATWVGYAMAWNGVAAVFMAPIAAMLSQKVDPRILVSGGIIWLAATSLIRVVWWTTGADFWTLAIPQLIQGAGMPFFFVPLTTLALGAVEENEIASAAGLMNFLRTMSGAIATAIGVTMWENGAQSTRDTLAGVLNGTGATMQTFQSRSRGSSSASSSPAKHSRSRRSTCLSSSPPSSSGPRRSFGLPPKRKHAVAMGGGH